MAKFKYLRVHTTFTMPQVAIPINKNDLEALRINALDQLKQFLHHNRGEEDNLLRAYHQIQIAMDRSTILFKKEDMDTDYFQELEKICENRTNAERIYQEIQEHLRIADEAGIRAYAGLTQTLTQGGVQSIPSLSDYIFNENIDNKTVLSRGVTKDSALLYIIRRDLYKGPLEE